MRKLVVGSIVVAIVVIAGAFFWITFDRTSALAKAPQIKIIPATPPSRSGQRNRAAFKPLPGPPHDPHDLSGIWAPTGTFGGPGAEHLADASVRTMWMAGPLPLTPAGFAAINANKGGKGPRSVAPSLANDPIGDANPPGLVRTLVYGRPIQFIMLPNEVVNLFEWFHFWRQIWTDGRKIPSDPDLLWFGTSIGHWDGDTFAVDTVGLDPRNWLDMWGAPESDAMRTTERWHRLDRDNMTFTITFNDPKFYTHPWTSDQKVWRYQPNGSRMGQLEEVIFAPADEKEFDKRIVDPNPVVGNGRKSGESN